jgi:hypothetical protein
VEANLGHVEANPVALEELVELSLNMEL